MDTNLCRVCLEEISDCHHSVLHRFSETTIAEKLQFVTGVMIGKHDGLSKMICQKCFDDTITAFNLKTRFLDTDRKLRSMQNGSDQNCINMIDIKIEQFYDETFPGSFTIKEEPADMKFAIVLEPENPNFIKETASANDKKRPRSRRTMSNYNCDDCDYSAKTRKSLERHLQAAHNYESSFKDYSYSKRKCAYCNYSYKTGQQLLIHRHSKHADTLSLKDRERISKIFERLKSGSDFVTCEICGIQIKRFSLKKHINSFHSESRNFQCDYCGILMNRRSQFIGHLKTHFGRQRNFQCEFCKKCFFSKQNMRYHVKFMHLPLEPVTCHCGKVFEKKTLLFYHINRVHKKIGVEKVPCRHCGKLLASEKNLKEHIEKFHTENNFICNSCGKILLSEKSLKTHQRKFHDEMKYKCDVIGCGKIFRFDGELLDHKNYTHLNLKNYKCTFSGCDKAYANNKARLSHYKLVHEKLRENCPVGNGCKFSVGRRDYMRNHLKKHAELSETEQENYLRIISEMNLV